MENKFCHVKKFKLMTNTVHFGSKMGQFGRQIERFVWRKIEQKILHVEKIYTYPVPLLTISM